MSLTFKCYKFLNRSTNLNETSGMLDSFLLPIPLRYSQNSHTKFTQADRRTDGQIVLIKTMILSITLSRYILIFFSDYDFQTYAGCRVLKCHWGSFKRKILQNKSNNRCLN